MIQSKIISNSVSLLISKLIPALLLTFINILYSRGLSNDDYGIYQTVWSFINVGVIITTFGVPRYIMTFGSIYANEKGEVLKLLLITFLFTLLPVFFYLFYYYNHFDGISKMLCILMLISQSFYLIQEANMISLLNNRILVSSTILYALLLFISHALILYVFGYNLNYCLVAIVFISLLRNLMVWKLSSSHRKDIASNETKVILHKWQLFWFGLNDSLQIITKWFDKLILIVLLPPENFAIYFNGTYELPVIGMALTVFQSVMTSYSAQTPNDDQKHIQLFNSSSLFMSSILFPLFAFAFIYAEQIINLLFSSSYHESAKLFAISSLLLPMRICSYTVLLQLKHKGRVIMIGSLIDFVTAISLMFILYPYLKLAGLALGVVVATYLQALFYLYHICKTYKISLGDLLPWRKLVFRFVISTAVLFTIKHFILVEFNSFNFILAAIATCLVALYYSNKDINLKQLIVNYKRADN